ncbi:MAG TPA: YkgJ family cysteine cluster protein [Phycisphaerae bacterium]|nr:YkgJ family cysteine cluster protein [Phycisphaerae bacterium]
MKLYAKTPWYLGGLAFECAQCGRCCQGPEEGYVWVTRDDIEAIAAHLRIPVDQMDRKYVRKVGWRYSLVERADNRDCIFLEADGDGRILCRIYSVRPVQCRTWPFWTTNLTTPEEWAGAGLRCPGINRGKLFDYDHIEVRRRGTRE